MRLLYFIPRYDSAAMGNRIHTEVIAAWRAAGVTTDVLSLASGIDRLTTSVEDGITIYRLPVSANAPTKLSNRALAAIWPYPYLAGAISYYRRFIRSARYDLVHIETAFPLGLVATLTPRRSSPPLAVTLPGADIMAEPAYDYGYARFATVRAMLPLIFRRAVTLRADSPQIRDLAMTRGAAPEKVVAIPYNITADSYPPKGHDLAALRQSSRAMLIERHNLDPQRPIVVSLNRLHPFKGIAYLVESLPHLRRLGLRPQVLIVGPNRTTPRFGDYAVYLRGRAAELGVVDDVHLVGGIPHRDSMAYLAGADVAVVPSVAESFSRVVIEAAAVGTPPVVTRTTGASAYVAEQQAGLLVEPCSGQAIAEALRTLLSNRDVWQGYSERAFGMAPAFSSAQIAADLLRLYQTVV
ncbi:glycosyltransferase family 4 protein [Candidatus Oscillochloris fontis]|uniref:glycosyltransferase family 4 protein n=1 Tax=Candidatus Oscillochloris fontis TaxID=2496868 RepID=UPI00101C0F86|nr:glycosyltransferase family 4 protein [Candidatus Oscillochloris fontis]